MWWIVLKCLWIGGWKNVLYVTLLHGLLVISYRKIGFTNKSYRRNLFSLECQQLILYGITFFRKWIAKNHVIFRGNDFLLFSQLFYLCRWKRRHKVCDHVFMASGIMAYLTESWNICFKYGSAANKSKCHMITIFMNYKEVLTLGVLCACWNLHFIIRDT